MVYTYIVIESAKYKLCSFSLNNIVIFILFTFSIFTFSYIILNLFTISTFIAFFFFFFLFVMSHVCGHIREYMSKVTNVIIDYPIFTMIQEAFMV